MTPWGRLTRVGRFTSVGMLDADLSGCDARLELLVTNVETGPSATSPKWIDKTSSRRMGPMSHARRFDHVGITVADLDTVTAFFVGLGLEVEGRTFVEGEFLDAVSASLTPAPRSS
jgi:hypothetical protein